MLRYVLAGILLACFASIALAGFPGGFLAIGAGGGGGGPTLSTTLVLTNDSGSSETSGHPTQMVGFWAADGELCSGAAPVFTDPGTGHVQDYSYGLIAYYSSGCFHGGTFMLQRDYSIAGSTNKTLNVTGSTSTTNCKQGGTTSGLGPWPCWGSGTAGFARTLTEVYNQACRVLFPPAGLSTTTWGDNLGGLTYGAWLNGDGNTYAVSKWLDGKSGTAWEVDTEMATSAGGTPHGQLRFRWYATALTDGSGSFGGLRWGGAVRQPKYDYDTPAKNYRVFHQPDYTTPSNGPNYNCNSGTSQPMTWLGNDGNPMTSVSFGASGNCCQINLPTTNNFYMGGGYATYTVGPRAQGAGGNAIPVKVSGSLNGNDPNQLYFIRVFGDGTGGSGENDDIAGRGPPQSGGALALDFTGASGTVTPLPMVEPWTRLNWMDSKGHYTFVQGTGSLTAETTIRVRINQAYCIHTLVCPPWDLSVTGAATGGTVVDEAHASNYWHPWHTGTMYQYTQAVGDHPDLGILPNDASVASYNDSVHDDLLVRSEGLSGGLYPYDFKTAAGDVFPNIADTAGTSTYTGLPNSLRDTLFLDQGYSANSVFTMPPNSGPGGDWGSAFSNVNSSHKPAYAPFAYIKTGELQYLEIMMDHATTQLLFDQPRIMNRNPTTPDNFGSAILGYIQELRTEAWDWRDWIWVAGLMPYDPTGTATTFVPNWGNSPRAVFKYFHDVVANNAKYAADILNPSNNVYGSSYHEGCATAPTTLCSSSGRAFWGEAPNLDTTNIASITSGVIESDSGEENNYVVATMNLCYALLKDANCKQWLYYWITGSYYTLTNINGYNLYQFAAGNSSKRGTVAQGGYEYTLNPTNGAVLVADDAYFGSSVEGGDFGTTYLFGWTNSSSAGNGAFTYQAPSGYPLFQQGDVFLFCSLGWSGSKAGCGTTVPPGGFTAEIPYWVTNVTQTSTSPPIQTFDLAPCTTRGSGANCTTIGSAVVPSNTQTPANTFTVGLSLRLTSAPGTGTANAFPSFGEGIATPYRANYEWATVLFGTGIAQLNALVADAEARFITDGFSPDTGSIYGSSGYVPRWNYCRAIGTTTRTCY